MSDPLDIAWAAGLFEGEGTIYTSSYGTKKYIRLQLRMSDYDVISHYASVMAGHVTGPYQKELNGRPMKPQWSWAETRQAIVIPILDSFWPYLGQRRKAKALELGYLVPNERSLTP